MQATAVPSVPSVPSVASVPGGGIGSGSTNVKTSMASTPPTEPVTVTSSPSRMSPPAEPSMTVAACSSLERSFVTSSTDTAAKLEAEQKAAATAKAEVERLKVRVVCCHGIAFVLLLLLMMMMVVDDDVGG